MALLFPQRTVDSRWATLWRNPCQARAVLAATCSPGIFLSSIFRLAGRVSSSPANMNTPRPSFSSHPDFTYSCAKAPETPRLPSLRDSKGVPRGSLVWMVLIRFCIPVQSWLEQAHEIESISSSLFGCFTIVQARLELSCDSQTTPPPVFRRGRDTPATGTQTTGQGNSMLVFCIKSNFDEVGFWECNF